MPESIAVEIRRLPATSSTSAGRSAFCRAMGSAWVKGSYPLLACVSINAPKNHLAFESKSVNRRAARPSPPATARAARALHTPGPRPPCVRPSVLLPVELLEELLRVRSRTRRDGGNGDNRQSDQSRKHRPHGILLRFNFLLLLRVGGERRCLPAHHASSHVCDQSLFGLFCAANDRRALLGPAVAVPALLHDLDLWMERVEDESERHIIGDVLGES